MAQRIIPINVTARGRIGAWFSGGQHPDPELSQMWQADILLSNGGGLRYPVFTRVYTTGRLLTWKVLQCPEQNDWVVQVTGWPDGLRQDTAEILAWRVEHIDDEIICEEETPPNWLLRRVPWDQLVRQDAERDCPWTQQRMEELGIVIERRRAFSRAMPLVPRR